MIEHINIGCIKIQCKKALKKHLWICLWMPWNAFNGSNCFNPPRTWQGSWYGPVLWRSRLIKRLSVESQSNLQDLQNLVRAEFPAFPFPVFPAPVVKLPCLTLHIWGSSIIESCLFCRLTLETKAHTCSTAGRPMSSPGTETSSQRDATQQVAIDLHRQRVAQIWVACRL